MSRWTKYEYDELVDILSDYHKDVHGYRLRMNGADRSEIILELDNLDRFVLANSEEYAEEQADLDAIYYGA